MIQKRMLVVLQQHGFFSGRTISCSKTLYCKRHPRHFVVLNGKVFTRRALMLRGADLDLTIDAENLTAAAREAGENFYVFPEDYPHPFWKPASMPMRQVLCSATW